MHHLDEKIRDRSVRHGVIGLGYVGLPLGLAFAQQGVRVLGFDVDPSKVASLSGRKRSRNPIAESAERFGDRT